MQSVVHKIWWAQSSWYSGAKTNVIGICYINEFRVNIFGYCFGIRIQCSIVSELSRAGAAEPLSRLMTLIPNHTIRVWNFEEKKFNIVFEWNQCLRCDSQWLSSCERLLWSECWARNACNFDNLFWNSSFKSELTSTLMLTILLANI